MNTRLHFCEQSSRFPCAPQRPWLRRMFALLVLGAGLTLLPVCPAAPFTFENTGSMSIARTGHTATLLQNGKILVVGGTNSPSAELYDPASGTWQATGNPLRHRSRHTATLLLDGKVLVTGGSGAAVLASCELYDPVTGTWSDTNNLTTARSGHTATLLPDGRVLVAGGGDDGYLSSAEIYDPAQETWAATGSMNERRASHTMTLLPNGKVLVAGGENHDGFGGFYQDLAGCELYNPSTGKWTRTGDLGSAREKHSATLLPNGKVLVAAGDRDGSSLASAQLYDPSSGTWAGAGNLGVTRSDQTASLLPNGKVLVVGGYGGGGYLTSAELYDPVSDTWTATDSTAVQRWAHTATVLASGKMLVTGGSGPGSSVASAELFDLSNGTWSAAATTVVAHAAHSSTILSNGQVLVAGGTNGTATVSSTELYDPPTSKWLATSSLNAIRKFHTATLLANGKVLVAGGAGNNALASAELYDRSTAAWTNTGSLNTSRFDHTATLLPNGKVLVTGGVRSSGVPPTTTYIASAELYDPASGTWVFTGSMATARHNHTATLLPDGRVLVSGGANANNNFLATCEVYNPSTGTWSATGSMANPRELHTATLLPRAQVLVAGGTNDATAQGIVLNSVEIYNPASGQWVTVPSLSTAREGHSATLMPDGRVMVYGGLGNGSSYVTTAEQYDPAINKWSAAGSSAARFRHTATLLPNGRVLAVGGFFGTNTATTNASLYDAGFGFSRPAWQPQISSAFTTTSGNGVRLFVNGSRFQGLSEASGGDTSNSATNYPVVQLRSIDNNQVAFFPVDPAFGWADTAFGSVTVSGFPFGPAVATVFTNGIPSDSKYLVLDPVPTPVSQLLNLSTRKQVGTGDNVLIGGFIVAGSEPKKVILRGIGPSLTVAGALADPTLELHDGNGTLATNDNWQDTQRNEIIATGIPPSNSLESAIVANLPAAPAAQGGAPYTGVLAGRQGGTGIGVLEVYDLAVGANSKLVNISTRGFVGTGNDVLIGGFIPGPSDRAAGKVLIRGLGPSLPVSGALQDPVLELHDGNGNTIIVNDSWRNAANASEIAATGIPPSDDREAAIVTTLQPSNSGYTAIVRGASGTTGVALVELYALP